MLSIAAKRNMYVKHFDAKTAFLNGTLKEELYMKQPVGFEVKGEETKVCKLKKSLYELKQSARAWNEAIHGVLIKNGYKQSLVDKCL